MKMKITLLSLAFALFAIPAMAQLPQASEVPAGSLAPSDAEFLRTVDVSNIDQLTLGKRASSGTKHSSVRSLADNVTASHNKADSALRILADVKNVDLDHRMSERAKSEAATLVSADPAADRLYVTGVVRDSRDLIGLYESALATSQDADIRKFADTMLPAVRDYQRQAEELVDREGLAQE